ncbi:hypothetical protein LLEC1_08123 [Akanthomyces lecanii]|uniref:Uncharacterized protein n=1 Tax=Cordyceps confragosa TaxID=2714763 RepID=A0A179IEB1_CORDF|nr:hypothetical protein LLEC1_08123 [Akanthomyces lecanii]
MYAGSLVPTIVATIRLNSGASHMDKIVTLGAISYSEEDLEHLTLGFAGHIQGKWFGVYGDNLGCAPGVHDPDKGDHQAHAFVRDSVAALTDHPLLVVNQSLDSRGYRQQFTPWIS